MKHADKFAEETAEPLELMERAGKVLADIVERAMRRLRRDEVLVVCGGGNNGGDGFVAARLLKERGRNVEVLCLSESFSQACAAEKERYQGTVLGRIPRRRYLLLVDCVLGTGISRAPDGTAAMLIEFINSCGGYVISADLPSGLSENGIACKPCVTANETVCMGPMKNCLLLADGADVAGKVTVADIGITPCEQGVEVWEDADVLKYFPKRKSNVHKGTFGSACILAGFAQFCGAPFLAVDACLKSGVGYTKFITDEQIFLGAVVRRPSCVLQKYRGIDEELLSADCIAVGMGAGVSKELYEQIRELLSRFSGTLIIDADGLNALAEYGVECLKTHCCRVILTPHPKEFSRLIKRDIKDVLRDAVKLAQEFAHDYGVTVILKNNRSIVTDGERTAINTTGSPALAKGGSGDVLCGFLCGTCARGLNCFEAACVSCYLLGRAGELCAQDLGEYCSSAEEIISRFPAAIASLTNGNC